MSEAEIQPQVTLRCPTLLDAPAMSAMYNAYVGNGYITFDMDGKDPDYFSDKLNNIAETEAWIGAYDGDGTLLGYGYLFPYSDRCGYRTTGETSVYLGPELKRRGIGSSIKHALIARARELGYHHLVARLVADNTASLVYNLRLGYEVVGTQREVGWVNGRWHDVVIMQLILD